MTLKKLLVVSIIFACLGSAFFYLEQQENKKKQLADSESKIIKQGVSDIQAFTLTINAGQTDAGQTNSAKPSLVLGKKKISYSLKKSTSSANNLPKDNNSTSNQETSTWIFEDAQLQNLPIDQGIIQNFLDKTIELQSSSSFPVDGKDEQYGLKNPNYQLRLNFDNQKQEIEFGGKHSFSGKQYIRINSSPLVHLIPDNYSQELVKILEDFPASILDKKTFKKLAIHDLEKIEIETQDFTLTTSIANLDSPTPTSATTNQEKERTHNNLQLKETTFNKKNTNEKNSGETNTLDDKKIQQYVSTLLEKLSNFEFLSIENNTQSSPNDLQFKSDVQLIKFTLKSQEQIVLKITNKISSTKEEQAPTNSLDLSPYEAILTISHKFHRLDGIINYSVIISAEDIKWLRLSS